MGKIKLSRFDFNDYRGAEQIRIVQGVPAPEDYLDEVAIDSSNDVYLVENEYDDFNYSLVTEDSSDKIYLNDSITGICRELTNLTITDLMDASKINYYHVKNMHTSFTNCYNLVSTPKRGSNVVSMYGAYYNCTNMAGSAVGGTNLTNMIGTYYNCTNLTSFSAWNNVKMMIGTYYNCVNLTGRPVVSLNAKSIEDCYYNCYKLSGSPANCNNALITINAYYNCPQIYGTFYWYEKNYVQADVINATNMFYNRQTSRRLNIYVRKGMSVENALVNYSDTFGNIYGVGAITWTPTSTGYYNSMYNTNIIYHTQQVILTKDIPSEGNKIVDDWDQYAHTERSGYNYNITENINITATSYSGIIKDSDFIPEGYITDSSLILNSTYNIRMYYKWLNYNLSTEKIVPHGDDNVNIYACYDYVNIKDYIIYTNNIDYEDIKFGTINGFNSQYFAFARKEYLNEYPKFFEFFNTEGITNYNWHFSDLWKDNTQIFDPPVSSTITNLDDAFRYHTNVQEQQGWSTFNFVMYHINDIPLYDTRYTYSNSHYYSWSSLYWNGVNHQKLLDFLQHNFIFRPTPLDIQIIPKSPDKVTRMNNTYRNFILAAAPKCGRNVNYLCNTYENCRNIGDFAVCGPNVIDMSGCYLNTDTTIPAFGAKVTTAPYAYRNTLINGDTIWMPDKDLDAIGLFGWCQELYNLDNLEFNQRAYYAARHDSFEHCHHLCFDADNTTQIPVNVSFFNGVFKNCWNLIEPMRINKERDNLPAPIYSELFSDFCWVYQNCNNLVYIEPMIVNHAQALNYTFANCPNLRVGFSYLNETNCSRWWHTFYNCYSLQGNFNLIFNFRGDQFSTEFSSTFYNCQNLTGFNYIYKHNNEEINVRIDSYSRTFYNCFNLGYVLFNTFDNKRNFHVFLGTTTFTNCQKLAFVHTVDSNSHFIDNCFLNISDRVFYDCQNLISLGYIPIENNWLFHDMLDIGGQTSVQAFYNCTNLISLNFKKNTTDSYIIWQNSFDNCTNLKYFTIYGIYSFSSSQDPSYHLIYNINYFEKEFAGVSRCFLSSLQNCNNLPYILFRNLFEYIYTKEDLDYMNIKRKMPFRFYEEKIYTEPQIFNYHFQYILNYVDNERPYVFTDFVFDTYNFQGFLNRETAPNLIDLSTSNYGMTFYRTFYNYHDVNLNLNGFIGITDFKNLQYLEFNHGNNTYHEYRDPKWNDGASNLFINCYLNNLNYIKISRAYNNTHNNAITYMKDICLFYNCHTPTILNKLELEVTLFYLNADYWFFNNILNGTNYTDINYLILTDITNLNFMTTTSTYGYNSYYPANNTTLYTLESIFNSSLNQCNFNTLVINTNHSGLKSLYLSRINNTYMQSIFGTSNHCDGYDHASITKTFRTFNNRFNYVLISEIPIPRYWFSQNWAAMSTSTLTRYYANLNFENIIGYFTENISINFGEKLLDPLSNYITNSQKLNTPYSIDFNNLYTLTFADVTVKRKNGTVYNFNNHWVHTGGGLQIAVFGGESGNSAYFGNGVVFDEKTETSLYSASEIDLWKMPFTNNADNLYRPNLYNFYNTTMIVFNSYLDANQYNYNLSYNLIQVKYHNTVKNISIVWYKANIILQHKYK